VIEASHPRTEPMQTDKLLAPFSPESPCGEDLSFSREFDAIREKRREDDPTLAQGDWKKALKVADWPGVAAQCEELLSRRTKDLRVAGWLADALGRTQGFAGLAGGLSLCAGLCNQHWATVYPLADEGDQEQRVGSLSWLLAQVSDLSRMAPVLASSQRRLGLRDIEAARAVQQLLARGLVDAASVAAKGTLTLDDVAKVQAATPRQFLTDNLVSVQQAIDALATLEAAVDARLGADGPGFSAARKALEDAMSSAQRFARDGGVAPVGESAAADVAGTAALPALGQSAPTGALQTRAQALQQLRSVAEFFRRTEPHSPVAYLADKAAQWGEMPLHAWLRVVLKDPNALAHVEELLGVEPPAAPG
jgi:type VI secretion system protein ImpA